MIYCESPTVEQWIPPPLEAFPRPTWTRLRAEGVELSNCVEETDWAADPVQSIKCEGCWTFECGRAAARIVRLGDHLLWLPPGLRDIDEFWREPLSGTNIIREAVLMPAAACGMPEAVGVTELRGVEPRLQEALASDPLALDPAREVVRLMVDWVLQSPGQVVEGAVVRARDCGSAINTFYFDGPPFENWPAFVVEQDNGFVLGNEWVFLSRQPRVKNCLRARSASK